MPFGALIPFLPAIGGAIGSLFKGKKGAAVGGLAGAAGSALFGGKKGNQSKDIQKLLVQFPQLRQSLELQARQQQRADPLHAALIQLSQRLLPNEQGHFTDPWGSGFENAVRERQAQLKAPIRVGNRSY